jgi:hypothetical protein
VEVLARIYFSITGQSREKWKKEGREKHLLFEEQGWTMNSKMVPFSWVFHAVSRPCCPATPNHWTVILGGQDGCCLLF